MLSYIYYVLYFAGTIVFSLSGCMAVENKPLRAAILPSAFSSFGGGFVRDILLRIFISCNIIPAAFSAYPFWGAAAIGFVWFAVVKKKNELYSLKRSWMKCIRTIVDYSATGLFCTAGVYWVRGFGVHNQFILTLLGLCTGLGGGLVTLIVFRERKKETFLGNSIYYLAAFVSSAMGAKVVDNFSEISISIIAAFFCAAVGAGTLCISDGDKSPSLRIKKGLSLSRKIKILVSPGALFRSIINPIKGIHQWRQIPGIIGTRMEGLSITVG